MSLQRVPSRQMIMRQKAIQSSVVTSRPILFFVLAVSVLAAAQEIKFIDLSSVEQRTTLRYPPLQSTSDLGKTGVGGASIADGAPDRRDPHALGISLDYVSTKNITLDPFYVEFRILNTGLVRWSWNLSNWMEQRTTTARFSRCALANGYAEAWNEIVLKI